MRLRLYSCLYRPFLPVEIYGGRLSVWCGV
nr:MAG TPA: hypothetical protein [Caudoviricetes sp.]